MGYAVKFELVWEISGQITESGAGLNGVTVELSGDVTDSTVSSGDVNYSFWVPDGTYTVTPSLMGYEFSPPAIVDFQVAAAGEPYQDFTGTFTGELVADNDDAILTGTWCTWSGSPCSYEGSDFRYHTAGTGAYSATWSVPGHMPADTYNVYAFIPCGLYKREDADYYTINCSGGSDPVGPFDHSDPANGGQWVLLKSDVSFDAGSGSVVLSGADHSVGYIDADAIKWVK